LNPCTPDQSCNHLYTATPVSYDTPTAHCRILVVNMSGRLVATRLSTLARRTPLLTPRLYTTHSLPAGGLLRNEAALRLVKRRPWPLGSYALHNLPATRSISFARVIPKLVGKFATVGAAAGGAVVAGVSYIQYQAGRMYPLYWGVQEGANRQQRREASHSTSSIARKTARPTSLAAR
jgi:hypothetical protein